MKRQFIILTAVLSAVLIYSVRAQEDPISLDPMKWRSSSAPIAAGLVVDLQYPWAAINTENLDEGAEAGGDRDNSKVLGLMYHVAAYYDIWQIGYAKRPYGNVIRLANRIEPARDMYNAIFVEFGSLKQHETLSYYDDQGFGDGSWRVVKLPDRSVSILMLGYNYVSFYGNNKSGAFLSYNFSAGTASADGDRNYIVWTDLGFGLRNPFGMQAVTIGIESVVGLIPSTDILHSVDYRGFPDSGKLVDKADIVKNRAVLGVGLFMRLGLGTVL